MLFMHIDIILEIQLFCIQQKIKQRVVSRYTPISDVEILYDVTEKYKCVVMNETY